MQREANKPTRRSASLEQRNHGEQGAQRHEQDAEGRGGAGVAQVGVAARAFALLSRVRQQLARRFGRITTDLVGAAARSPLIAAAFRVHLQAHIKTLDTVRLSSIVFTIGAGVALDGPGWMEVNEENGS